MNNSEIYSCAQMIDYVNKIGILPLLNLGIPGWSADDAVSDDCRYAVLPDYKIVRMRLRQVHQQEGGVHKPRMVAALLQLAAKHCTGLGGRQHRIHDSGDAARRRQHDNARFAARMRIHWQGYARKVRQLRVTPANGMPHRMGMVTAFNAGTTVRQRGLSYRMQAAAIIRAADGTP